MSGFASRIAGFGVRFAAVVAVTTLAVTVLVAPAGAAWAGSSTSAPDPDTNVAETARLERELLKLPGVASARVTWSTSWPSDGTTSVTVTTTADPATLHPQVLRVVWRGRLDPMPGINVGILRGRSPVDFVAYRDMAALERELGRRPVGRSYLEPKPPRRDADGPFERWLPMVVAVGAGVLVLSAGLLVVLGWAMRRRGGTAPLAGGRRGAPPGDPYRAPSER